MDYPLRIFYPPPLGALLLYIAFILEKSGVLKKLNGNWKARTISNKCAIVQGLINQSKVCHLPTRVGDWPKIGSPAFVKSISGDCPKCYKAWARVLLNKGHDVPPLDKAAKELRAEIPECSDLTDKIVSSLRGDNEDGMPLGEILSRLPMDLRGVMLHLT